MGEVDGYMGGYALLDSNNKFYIYGHWFSIEASLLALSSQHYFRFYYYIHFLYDPYCSLISILTSKIPEMVGFVLNIGVFILFGREEAMELCGAWQVGCCKPQTFVVLALFVIYLIN
jgi:hypothetical protein